MIDGSETIVYNGPLLEYLDEDEDLLPYTDYQYMVTAANTEGQVVSLWGKVTTSEAAPDEMSTPTVKVRKHLLHYETNCSLSQKYFRYMSSVYILDYAFI